MLWICCNDEGGTTSLAGELWHREAQSEEGCSWRRPRIVRSAASTTKKEAAPGPSRPHPHPHAAEKQE